MDQTKHKFIEEVKEHESLLLDGKYLIILDINYIFPLYFSPLVRRITCQKSTFKLNHISSIVPLPPLAIKKVKK